jgi:two-component system cell cycle response regulator
MRAPAIILPRRKSRATRKSAQSPNLAALLTMKKILVVDDFEVVRLYHSMFLSQKGYRCIPASDGKEALGILRQQRVDLVLLDLVMPKMSGQEVIRHIRAIPELATLPILGITSEAMRAEESFPGDRRYLRFLLKPVMPDTLVTQVRSMLDLAGPAASA